MTNVPRRIELFSTLPPWQPATPAKETDRVHDVSWWEPDRTGHFGPFGGQHVGESMKRHVDLLAAAFDEARRDQSFHAEFRRLLIEWGGRPTPLHEARRLAARVGGARIFLKREDLSHTGTHASSNALGQALLARRMGRPRVIAETGAGGHGVAVAAAAALLDLACTIYMGEEDVKQRSGHVSLIRSMGAEVIPVTGSGRGGLLAAIDAAIRDQEVHPHDTFWIPGSAVGAHPYPLIVREFMSVIGRETRYQLGKEWGGLPVSVVASAGGGGDAIGMFHGFLADERVALIGAEGGGRGEGSGQHAAALTTGTEGVLHGARTLVLRDDAGAISDTHSVAPVMNYPAAAPEHAWLRSLGRVRYVAVSDEEAVAAARELARCEGIVASPDAAHAVHLAMSEASKHRPDEVVVASVMGRVDLDGRAWCERLAQER